ncbi:CPBP family intramembrane glutamic endopeptidase [Ruegeria faecimaris]|uniref:CPBP family intramembrane glutamic endopeptidase n=1 Tax=Ruegeria faecimaris TaxID=686389 RepID=UPI002330EA11|nr:type II CAAX endopeptidase family protein [Ruegeria faecimaris]
MSEIRAPSYAPHEQLVADARDKPQLWRLLAGLATIVVVATVFNLILFAVVTVAGPQEWASGLMNGSTPISMVILLSSFGFVTFGVWTAARQFQKRSLGSILGTRGKATRQFWLVLRALMVLGVVIVTVPHVIMDAPLVQNLSFSVWLVFLPLSLLAVFVQISAEELLFRGYMQQSLAARFRSPIIWMGVPSLLFAVGHYSPDAAGGNAELLVLWTGLFGLLAADLTARAGTLGPAIALHFFNNVIALLFVSLPDTLSGLALFVLPFDMTDTLTLRQWLYVDFAVMIVSWFIARLALRR